VIGAVEAIVEIRKVEGLNFDVESFMRVFGERVFIVTEGYHIQADEVVRVSVDNRVLGLLDEEAQLGSIFNHFDVGDVGAGVGACEALVGGVDAEDVICCGCNVGWKNQFQLRDFTRKVGLGPKIITPSMELDYVESPVRVSSIVGHPRDEVDEKG